MIGQYKIQIRRFLSKICPLYIFIWIILGSLLYAIGLHFFIFPYEISMGGVGGISVILSQYFSVSASILLAYINYGLLLLTFLILGKTFALRTIIGSLTTTVFINLLAICLPLQATMIPNIWCSGIIGTILVALGSAILFSCDSSSGGTDIMALILKKFTSLDVGKALLAVDFVVAASAFVVFDIPTGLFSLLGLFAKAFIVDAVIENFHTCKYFVVITTEREKVSDYIIKTLHHGATVNTVVGEYTHTEKAMIHTVCKRIEAVKLRSKIKEIDPHAFIIITTSSEIIGRGFRSV